MLLEKPGGAALKQGTHEIGFQSRGRLTSSKGVALELGTDGGVAGGHPLSNDLFWDAATPRQGRSRLLDALRLELRGPQEATEVLTESPLTRYAVGLLAPFGTEVANEELGDELVADGDDCESSMAAEAGPPMSQALTPSSIGLSFLIPSETELLEVRASWGDYDSEEIDDPASPDRAPENEGVAGEADPEAKGKRRRPRLRWPRTPRDPDAVPIRLTANTTLQRLRVPGHEGVTVEFVSRPFGDCLAVSVFLVNRRVARKNVRPPVDRWMFQPSMEIRSASGAPVFLPRNPAVTLAHSDRDTESNRLLFRGRREFAVGHGCAAVWSANDDGSMAEFVRTELIPFYEIPRVDALPIGGPGLDMAALADAASPVELRGLVEPLLKAYAAWISEKQASISELAPDLQAVARAHLEECGQSLERMKRGLGLLLADIDAFKAFCFANRAMLLQRSHTLWAQQRRRDPASAPERPTLEGVWRPFQLGFILLNLPGLIDPESDDRQIGDLLWFPTGGGKTEAYLGLAAFTMALRRRRHVPGLRTDAGVAVLMRYTLRLLTIQQFQRAATLLCACETLRQAEPDVWGAYRFSIGLWVGMEGTPNTHADSRRALLRLQADPSEEGANPCVLETCPWCGEALRAQDYWTDGDKVRTRVACPRRSCPFSRRNNSAGIPVVAVDEEIYRECPSMMIATVDKFAQMPWNGEIQSLFGLVGRECGTCGFLAASNDHGDSHKAATGAGAFASVRDTERLAPPDLIIQDELHLISGPLGTLVGLYETAVDHLCSRPVGGRIVRPKIIASTATVRRAFEQVQAIFQRELRVFPPPGLDPEDSFFATERSVSDDTPGRLYVGVCAPGKSMATAYVRVAALLFSASAGLRKDPLIAEPYSTLVSYFNSLRELGGAIRLMDDDIPARLEQLKTAGLPRHQRPVYVELTSRIRQEAIPLLLRRLEQRHDAPHREEDPLPLDVVLASSMISVGVDVDRLGLMIVRGQPKTTAEYIQATSRVGRQAWGPGLVVTIYNWARPRDLSHYERFLHYHATLYRNVEAVSATPFSSRALDRGVRGAFVSMVRLGDDELSGETSAVEFNPRSTDVALVMEAFRRRADAISGEAAATSVVETLKGLADEWWGYRTAPLRYGWRSPDPASRPSEDVLLRVPESGRIGHWPAPQSLREVEDVSLVRVLGLDV